MPPENSVASLTWIEWFRANGWVITLVGVAINLGWNLYNSWKTAALGRSTRASTVHLEEFRSRIRSPIETALVEIENGKRSLRSLETSGKPAGELRNEVSAEWQKVVAAYTQLGDALEEANRSAFAEGNDWAQLGENDWDVASRGIDKALNAQRPIEENRQGVRETLAAIAGLVTCVRNRVELEVRNNVSAKR